MLFCLGSNLLSKIFKTYKNVLCLHKKTFLRPITVDTAASSKHVPVMAIVVLASATFCRFYSEP